MKKIIALIMVFILSLSPIFSLAGCSQKNDLTMGAWLSYISEYFGMESYQQSTPYFSNVTAENDDFSAFQMAAEWEVLRPDDKIKSSDKVTWETALVSLVNAGEFLPFEETDDKKIAYAIQNFDETIRKYWMSRTIHEEEALILLAKVQDLWATRKYAERIEKINYNDDVIDLPSQNIEYTVLDDGILLPKNAGVEVGDICITTNPTNPIEKQYHRVEKIENISGALVAKTETDVELQEVFEELHIKETLIPTAENTVIYDGNGNLISDKAEVAPQSNNNLSTSITTLSYHKNKYDIVNCAQASVKREFNVSGVEVGLSYNLDGAMDFAISVKSSNLLGDDSGKGQLELEEEFELSNLSITHNFDWGFLKLKSAELKLDYETKNKASLSYSNSGKWIAAPGTQQPDGSWLYNNGNGKFLTNFKKALASPLKADGTPGAKTIASKKQIKICSLNVYSAAVAKICLDVNLNISFDGSITVTVTESGSKGIEYKNGNIRFIKTCNKSAEAEIKAKIELTMGFGPALYVVGLKKKLVGLEARLGVGASASVKAHLADAHMHLMEELDFNDMSPEILQNVSSSASIIKATTEDIQAVAEAQGGIYKAEAATQVDLHVDYCLDVKVYGIVSLGVTDQSYLVDFVGDKVNLNISILSEKNGTFFNIHVDNFIWRDAVFAFGSKASVDNCTLKYIPFDKAEDETEENESGETEEILTGENLQLSTMNVTMNIGQEYPLNILQIPKEYSIEDIEFHSNNRKIATVTSNGVIEAKDSGCTVVYAQTKDGEYKTMVSVIVTSNEEIEFEGLIVES